MCLQIYPDSNRIGKGHDSLSWPLREKIVIALLNQSSDSQHHNDTMNFNELQNVAANYTSRVIEGNKAKKGWGTPKFITHENIHMHKLGVSGDDTIIRQFLKDGCLFLQISKV